MGISCIFIIAIQRSAMWYLVVFLIFISLTNNQMNIFSCNPCWLYFLLEKFLVMSLLNLKYCCLVFFTSLLYLVIYLFFHFVTLCIFLLIMMRYIIWKCFVPLCRLPFNFTLSFDFQKVFSLTHSDFCLYWQRFASSPKIIAKTYIKIFF